MQVWDLVTKKDVACVIDAHNAEIYSVVTYFGHAGSESVMHAKTNSDPAENNALNCNVFVTGGLDQQVKVWEIHQDVLR